MKPPRKTKVVAIASGGGHWVQLLRLRPAFADSDVTFVTVLPGYRSDVEPGASFRVIPDSNRSEKLKVIASAISIFWMLLSERPDVVISTGAAPGYLALRIGKMLGARTIWVDSIANAEELSLSGQKAAGCADLWLTQWQHLAQDQGPHFKGSVL